MNRPVVSSIGNVGCQLNDTYLISILQLNSLCIVDIQTL